MLSNSAQNIGLLVLQYIMYVVKGMCCPEKLSNWNERFFFTSNLDFLSLKETVNMSTQKLLSNDLAFRDYVSAIEPLTK